MTKQELNRDIKRLWKAYINLDITKESYYSKRDKLGEEFKRLYNADKTFEYMNKESILVMYNLNLKCRWVQLHMMGINADDNPTLKQWGA